MKHLIYLQMDIGYSGMVNEYLAAQGPLSDTCSDFWQVSMVLPCTVQVTSCQLCGFVTADGLVTNSMFVFSC